MISNSSCYDPFIVEPSVGAKPMIGEPVERVDTSVLSSAIPNGVKLRLRYRSEYRHFHTDRIIEAETLDEGNGLRQGELRRRWQLWREANLRSSGAVA
jgi:hypothetical protein